MNRTIELRGIEFEIEFDYYPEEQPVYYMSNGDPGYPGSPAEVEIQDITFEGVSMYEFFEEDLEQFEEAILEQM